MHHSDPVHEHLGIKQIWLISRRSILIDVAKTWERTTERFALTISSIHLPCVQNKQNVTCTKSFCLYCSGLWLLTSHGEYKPLSELHLYLIPFKGLILLENKEDSDLWRFHFFQIWHTKFQRITEYIWKIKDIHLGISLGYSSFVVLLGFFLG